MTVVGLATCELRVNRASIKRLVLDEKIYMETSGFPKGERMEEKKKSRLIEFLKPNTSKIMVAGILFIILSLVIPCPAHLDTFAYEYGGEGLYWAMPTNVGYDGSALVPLAKAIINNGEWSESTYIDNGNVMVFETYSVSDQTMMAYAIILIFLSFVASCFIEEYYRQKSLKSYQPDLS